MEKIYNVSIRKFNSVEKTSTGYRYEVNTEEAKELLCIQDGEDMVSLDNNERYYILKRTENGFLKPGEFFKIKLNEYYASHAEGIDFKKYPMLEVLKLQKKCYETKKRIMNAEKTYKKEK